METQVQEVVQEEPSVAAEAVSSDPFALDEARFASLSPEQRAALDPVFEEWKTKAKTEIEKTGKTYQEKYKPLEEKAQALDNLVKDQRFVSWWQNIQNAAAQQNPQSQEAIAASRPQDFASPQEWQQAIIDASNGDSNLLRTIQARMFATMATPVIQRIEAGQKELRTTMEMRDLFDNHPDAKDLDKIGSDAGDGKSESLLEACLNWADDNGRPLEEGYMRARRWADALRVGAKQEAMGLVTGKKASVTSGPTTAKAGASIVEVADADELMQKNMEYVISGQTPPKFVIRPPAANNRDRWSQKT